MKATALLRADHKHILRAFKVLDRMAVQAQRGEIPPDRDLDEIVRFQREFVDRHHRGKEELVFFPTLTKDLSRKNYRHIWAAVDEHSHERSAVEWLENGIARHPGSDLVFYAGRLTEILRHHMESEEAVLFELADAALTEFEDTHLALEMQNYEHWWQKTSLPDLLHRLGALEARYPNPAPAPGTAP